MNEETLFELLVNTPETQRSALLDLHCAGNPQLRARLKALLAADLETSFNNPAQVPSQNTQNTRTFEAPAETEGTIIAGRYKLLQQIGEGGMGTVWMADQTEPVKRRVAVKLIRTDRGNSAKILARFEAERQAIALMDHPNIARLLDAGTTDDGAPYFVMELVKGIPLNEYCDRHKLSVADRLQLFMQICGAVQHAHQKGIIHRDLKPSNILVESHDPGAPGLPKVIDFGLAKATTGMNLTENTLFTGFGTVMGTPLYMAPEQASFNASDIDTRADIYSLGVILYELLTGTTPLTRESIKQAALDEMLRLIRDQEAPTPSSRLSSSDAVPTIAANRLSEPARLGRFVRGELDWITLKALAKERERRYETANGFAKDIERFLNHEPVSAGPPSASYRFKKFVQRNQGQVVAASLVLATLVLGMIGTTIGYFRAEQAAERERQAKIDATDAAQRERLAKNDAEAERVKAVAERDEKERQRQRAEENERLAADRLVQVQNEQRRTEEEKRIAQAVRDFLQKKLLLQADARSQANSLLEHGYTGNEVEENPRILDLLARASEELKPDRIEESFPNQPLLQAELLETVGCSYTGIGGKDNDRYALAIQFLERALKIRTEHLGPYHIDTLPTFNNLGTAYFEAGEFEKAKLLYEEAFSVLNNDLGPNAPETLGFMGNIAKCYLALGESEQALLIFEKTVDGMKERLGTSDPKFFESMTYLARAYQATGQLDRALPLFEKNLETMNTILGNEDPRTLIAMNDLAVAYSAVGTLDRAVLLLEKTLAIAKLKLGRDHPHVFSLMDNLAGCYIDIGQVDKGLQLYEEALSSMKVKLGPDHPHTQICMNNLAHTLQSENQLSRALPLFEEVATGLERRQFLLDFARVGISNTIAAYEEANEFSHADAWRAKWLTHSRATAGADSPEYAGDLAAYGLSLLRRSLWANAEPVLRECLDIRVSSQPDQWTTFNTMSLLGEALLGKAKLERDQTNEVSMARVAELYREAEPLLLRGYEGMTEREATIPPQASTRIPEAIDRLIELYTVWDKPDDAKKWQAEKEKRLQAVESSPAEVSDSERK